MIIEKRKYIRKPKAQTTDWQPQPNAVEEYWGDIRLPEVTSKSTLLVKMIIAGLIGYFIGKFFFLD